MNRQEAVFSTDISGLTPPGRGKVRDIYDLGETLLILATDRLSAFDVVFPTPIPDKGRVLTQMTLFWLEQFRGICPQHLITADTPEILDRLRAAGAVDDESLEGSLDGRSMVVHKASPFPIECVVRGYISGSLWKEYSEAGKLSELHGHALPTDLRESDRLPQPIFTPATKATTGHDENISIHRAAEIVGQDAFDRLESLSIELYNRGRDIAASRGIIIADTKFEFGIYDDQIMLIDEILTPDSSRFWDAESYSPGGAQDSFDKQFVRDWVTALGWDKKPPAPAIPPDVVAGTTGRYREAYRRLIGKDLGG